MADEATVDLEPGDFLYQGDQELFLVVMDTTEDGYRFAVHGWREISEDRLDDYLNPDAGIRFLHHGEEAEQVIEEEGDEHMSENFEKLKRLFENYEDADFGDDGPHTEFALEDV